MFSLAVDNCNDSPCLNNGTCKHLPDGFSCDCAEGFKGLICQGDPVDIRFQLRKIKLRLPYWAFELKINNNNNDDDDDDNEKTSAATAMTTTATTTTMTTTATIAITKTTTTKTIAYTTRATILHLISFSIGAFSGYEAIKTN